MVVVMLSDARWAAACEVAGSDGTRAARVAGWMCAPVVFRAWRGRWDAENQAWAARYGWGLSMAPSTDPRDADWVDGRWVAGWVPSAVGWPSAFPVDWDGDAHGGEAHGGEAQVLPGAWGGPQPNVGGLSADAQGGREHVACAPWLWDPTVDYAQRGLTAPVRVVTQAAWNQGPVQLALRLIAFHQPAMWRALWRIDPPRTLRWLRWGPVGWDMVHGAGASAARGQSGVLLRRGADFDVTATERAIFTRAAELGVTPTIELVDEWLRQRPDYTTWSTRRRDATRAARVASQESAEGLSG